MRSSTIVISIAAVVMGAIAALLVGTWLRSHSREAAREVHGTIVVAASKVGLGVTLTDDNLARARKVSHVWSDGPFHSDARHRASL